VAGTGEILVSTDAAAAAGIGSNLERREIALKGRQEPIEVVTLRVAR
jgi:class 3 adenylate cyclase